MTFLPSPQGTVSLDGHDIRQLNPVWLRSKIGAVSQVRGTGFVFIALSFKIAFVTCFLLGLESLKRERVEVFQMSHVANCLGLQIPLLP